MENSVIKIYKAQVFKWAILIFTGACCCAGVTFGTLRGLGFYQTVPWPLLISFITVDLFFLAFGIFLIRRSMANGRLSERVYNTGKYFIICLEFIQFNFILYMIPSRVFLGYTFFFLILAAFFLDLKMLLIVAEALSVSLAVSWFVKGDIALPAKNERFLP